MDVPYRIRRAQPADRPGLIRVEQASFSTPWEDDAFEVNDDFLWIVAEAEAETGMEVVGFALGSAVLDEGDILNIAVAPAARGSGVGAALLESLIREMQETGVRSVYLDVRESNRAAISLYRKIGFSEVGLRRRYYANPVENAVQMSLILDV